VDTDTITHISLCTGYGGIDLALKRVFGERLRTIAYSEIEGFAVANLVSKAQAGYLDDAPIWSDLRSFPWDEFHGLVGILSGGFPCQPFSAAGKRNADSDPRHIFPAILEGISRCRPRLVFLENVEGIISAKLAGDDWRDPAGTPVLLHVLRELERVGYCPTAGLFSASETGAPHQRKRTFLLAYDSSVGIQGCGASWLQEPRPHAGQALPLCGGDAGGEKLADSQRPRLEGQHHRNASAEQAQDVAADAWASGECGAWPSRPGEPQHAWEPPRVVGNAQQFLLPATREHGAMDEASGIPTDRKGSEPAQTDPIASATRKREGHGRNASEFSETQPSVGRDADGPAGGLDYAELCVSCDNRTDELRLLGNGVCVPAGERAFRTLIQRFF
jgi:DNA (cytosine-5)-methyltransferase 1